MSREDGKQKRRGYHHGNLREALIDTALSLISQKGPAGFTIAEAARAAGVSPAAPYRHFKDRDALIADVAERGFEVFAKGLAEAWAEGIRMSSLTLAWGGRVAQNTTASATSSSFIAEISED